ncbi:MAG TPA: hypothetical protein ENN76_02235, partial [Euryarchaeota archaeon]|nr:hypothetical protein [Euryarchaeota archaeon]
MMRFKMLWSVTVVVALMMSGFFTLFVTAEHHGDTVNEYSELALHENVLPYILQGAAGAYDGNSVMLFGGYSTKYENQ